MRTRTSMPIGLVLVLSTALWGCAYGKTKILFATRTNLGLDVSTTPPTFDLALSRTEGVLEPQFENGKTLPVLSSFKFKTDRMFSPAVGNTFATGDAAIALALLYDEGTYKDGQPSERKKEAGKADGDFDSKVSLNNEPVAHMFPTLFRLGLLGTCKWCRHAFQGKAPSNATSVNVRPLFFGTDTALGLKVAWSGMTATYPDSVRFGYNRKELALVSVAKELEGNKHKVSVPSLLATLDTMFKVGSAEKGVDSGHVQYFATGDAATLLAMHQEVRQAMHWRLDPFAAQRASVFRQESPGRALVVTRFLQLAHDILSELEGEADVEAALHRRNLDAIAAASRIPATLAAAGLHEFRWDGSALTVDGAGRTFSSAFSDLVAYRSELSTSITEAEAAITAGTTTAGGLQVTDEVKRLVDEFRRLDEQAFADQRLAAAYEYVRAKISGM